MNRVETRWVLAVLAVIWSLTQLPMLGNIGLWTLVGCRIVLGAGEGPSLPVALHSAYKWFENDQRTLPTAVILQGGALGIVLALPALNFIIVNYSWRWAFGALAIVGLLWVALWLALAEEGPLAEASPGESNTGHVPYSRLLSRLLPRLLLRRVFGQLGAVSRDLLVYALSDFGSWVLSRHGGLDLGHPLGRRHCRRP